MSNGKIKFDKSYNPEFFATLKKRVNAYFEDNNISKYGNGRIISKGIVITCVYLVPFVLILMKVFTNPIAILGLWAIMGVGMAGIGFNVMHDGNHGSVSTNKTINKISGLTMNFLGGDSKLWKLQHNVLHHTYTNVYEADKDIDSPAILRFSPHHPKLKIHRFQHYYAVFLYGLITLGWCTIGDYQQVFSFKKLGLIKKEKLAKELMLVIFWKIVYFGYLIALPIFVFNVPVFITISGFLVMHLICGVIISLVFQLAHVMPEMDYPLPNDKGIIENSWAIHQLQTTCNFSQNSKLVSWYVGGLNYQIEHHLFDKISHVHYSAISKIVKSTAQEFGIQYKTNGSFLSAILEHFKLLKKLGRA